MTGCEIHTAFVYDRGGRQRIAQITGMTQLSWERVADDVSFCDIVVVNPSAKCASVLESMEPGRHEIVVFRGSTRVWEGPLTLMTYTRDEVRIQARDVMHYAYRLAQSRDYDNRYPNVTTCIARSLLELTTELGRRESEVPPINVVPYLRAITRTDDARTTRYTTIYQKTIFDDIDDMAANSGMDYTVVGRSIVLHDTNTVLGRTATLTEKDIIGDIVVTMYGMEMATFAVVTGADGAYGQSGGTDPYYGRVEIVDDAYDEEEGSDKPSQSELNSQAQRNLSGRVPTPVEVRVPDGSRISPASPMTIDDLIPGVAVPLRATLTARTFSQMQKLRKVRIFEDGDGEQIQITLVPAPATLHYPGPQPTVLRTNRAPTPIATTMGGPWSFAYGDNEAVLYSADNTAGAGPQGRTGFIRQTVTNAKTGGSSGWRYEDATGAGVAGEVWSAGMWVRFGTTTTVTPRLAFYDQAIDGNIVGSTTGPGVSVPANTWTYVKVDSATSTAAYKHLQFWAQVTGVVAKDSWYDATNLIFEYATTVGTYFDGSFTDTSTLLYDWVGNVNTSQSTVSSPPVLAGLTPVEEE
jgi:hypothetical protein